MTRQQKKKKKRIRCNNNSGGRERKTHAHNISLLPNQIYADDCHHRQKKKFKLKGYCSSTETQEDAAALCVCVCVSVLSTIIQTLHKSPSSSSVTPWFFCLIHLSKVEHGGGNSLSHVSRFIIPAPKRLGKSSITYSRRHQVFKKKKKSIGYSYIISFDVCVQTFFFFTF